MGLVYPQNSLPFIFERFHQADHTNNNQGSGIGLALVKELVTIMEGTIEVESELDRGTTIKLYLPIQDNPEITTELKIFTPDKSQIPLHESNPLPSEIDDELPILLVIEDSDDVIYYLQACLEDNYQILTARNGKKGVEKALEILPDIIISDVMMPEMSGFEVCKILKEDETQ